MALNPKTELTELDHIRETLTGVLGVVGESRKDIKQIKAHLSEHDRRFDNIDNRLGDIDKRLDGHDKRFDDIDKRLDGHDKRFDDHDKRFDKQDKEIAEIKEMVKTLLSQQFPPFIKSPRSSYFRA